MKRQAYLDLLEKHRKEINEFPIAYAFNEEQLKDALKKLGVESTNECVTVFNHGDIVKKENAPKFIEMLKRHTNEIKIAMKEEAFAEAAFLYEMDNHEYAINWDGDDDVLSCFGFNFDDLRELKLMGAYRRARDAHMKHAEEWDMI
jgi:ADP-dependent phosphofructokinase/glucokinase